MFGAVEGHFLCLCFLSCTRFQTLNYASFPPAGVLSCSRSFFIQTLCELTRRVFALHLCLCCVRACARTQLLFSFILSLQPVTHLWREKERVSFDDPVKDRRGGMADSEEVTSRPCRRTHALTRANTHTHTLSCTMRAPLVT